MRFDHHTDREFCGIYGGTLFFLLYRLGVHVFPAVFINLCFGTRGKQIKLKPKNDLGKRRGGRRGRRAG
jgi:hypothetical protein